GATVYAIEVTNPDHRVAGVAEATLDGQPVDARSIPLTADGQRHEVSVRLGTPESAEAAPSLPGRAAGPGRPGAPRGAGLALARPLLNFRSATGRPEGVR